MNVYLYDGTFYGFLSAVFYAYTDKDTSNIQKQSSYTPHLFETVHTITTEEDKAQRIITSICEKLSSYTLHNLYYIFLSECPNCEIIAFRYLKLCYHTCDKANNAHQNPLVHQALQLAKKVSLELHRMKGFVRFNKIDEIYYATISPDHNLLPIMVQHFTERFRDQHFVIYDIKRHYALAYDANKKEHWFCETDDTSFSRENDDYAELFRLFYQAITITERENLSLQKKFMPLRYRKYMPETAD